MLYKLFYTHNRSKDTGHFNAKSFRKCTHSERGGSHLEWTASLCTFSVPALWNSSPIAHHNDATLQQCKMGLTGLNDSPARVENSLFYSLALTSMSLSYRPLLYDMRGGFLKISLSNGCCSIVVPVFHENLL